MTYDQIIKDVEKGKFAPVYYLHGEETYFTDKIADLLEEKVVSKAEASFNRTLMYGAETNAQKLLTECRSFPVMANRRLVLLREAQSMSKKETEKLVEYLKKPVPSTVLVLAFKGKEGALGKAAATAVSAGGGIDFVQKKMYDKDVKAWLAALIASRGMQADPGVADIFVDNLGTNLHFIENELDKLLIYLEATNQNKLTKAMVYDAINVDKEFNVFELVGALCARDVPRAHMITDKLTRNAKINPPVITVSALFRMFHTLSLIYSKQLTDVNAIKDGLGVNYYAAQDYAQARKHYPLAVTYRNLALVQETDLMLKGQIATTLSEEHLLKTLVWRILN